MSTFTTPEIHVPLEAAQIAMSAAPEKGGRPALACVHLDIRGKLIAASDGFRMASMVWEPGDTPDTFPDSILVPAASIIAIAKQAKRGETEMRISIDTETGKTVRLSVLSKTGLVWQDVTIVDETYPDVRQIYPRQDPGDVFTVGPDYMIKIMQAYKKVGATAVTMQRYPVGNHITFHGAGPNGAIDSMLMTIAVKPDNTSGLKVEINPEPKGVEIEEQAAD